MARGGEIVFSPSPPVVLFAHWRGMHRGVEVEATHGGFSPQKPKDIAIVPSRRSLLLCRT